MIAKILKRRMEDIECVTRNVSLNESDPAIIAPTIAHIAPPVSSLSEGSRTIILPVIPDVTGTANA